VIHDRKVAVDHQAYRAQVTLPQDWTQYRAAVDPATYEQRWAGIENPHGEADLVASYGPRTVLDAGCGTGRVAIELARRGIAVVGVDADPAMLDAARAKAPELTWELADLADVARRGEFDVVVLAGNVVPYVAPDRRAAAVAACARALAPGGRLVAGFALRPDWPTVADYDGWCAGLALEARYATWDRARYDGGPYAVSTHRHP